MSILKQQVDSSPTFVSSSVSWHITRLYFFSPNNIYFSQKQTIRLKIFEIFECSGQTLPNALCQFWNDKLAPLELLYPSSVSWKIIRLYFLSSKNRYLPQKETIIVKSFDTFKCSGQILWNFICKFWNDKSMSPQILYPSSVSSKITPLYFFNLNNIYFSQNESIIVNIFETFESSG